MHLNSIMCYAVTVVDVGPRHCVQDLELVLGDMAALAKGIRGSIGGPFWVACSGIMEHKGYRANPLNQDHDST